MNHSCPGCGRAWACQGKTGCTGKLVALCHGCQRDTTQPDSHVYHP